MDSNVCYKCGGAGHVWRTCINEQEIIADTNGNSGKRTRGEFRRYKGAWDEEGPARKTSNIPDREIENSPITTEINNLRGMLKGQQRNKEAMKIGGETRTRSVGTQTEISLVSGNADIDTRKWTDVVRGRNSSMEGKNLNKEVGEDIHGSNRERIRKKIGETIVMQATTRSRGGIIKRKRNVGTAVLVRHAEVKDYKEILKEVKEKAGPSEEFAFTSVRKTRTGGVLFELKDEGSADEWAGRIKDIFGDLVSVRKLVERNGVKIRGLDALVSAEEIREALLRATNKGERDREQFEVVRIIKEPWEEQVALLKVPREAAETLVAKGSINIGLTVARVSSMPALMTRCWRCKRYGHTTATCQLGRVQEEVREETESAESGSATPERSVSRPGPGITGTRTKFAETRAAIREMEDVIARMGENEDSNIRNDDDE